MMCYYNILSDSFSIFKYEVTPTFNKELFLYQHDIIIKFNIAIFLYQHDAILAFNMVLFLYLIRCYFKI